MVARTQVVSALGVDFNSFINLYTDNGSQENQAEGQEGEADAPVDAAGQEVQAGELFEDGNNYCILLVNNHSSDNHHVVQGQKP